MRTSSRIGHNNLITSSLVPFQSCLEKSLSIACEKTLENLFLQAENASSNQQETQLFEQYNALKKNQSYIINVLGDITKSMPDSITEQISLSNDEISLSLVEDEELEISLAFTQLESVLDIRFSNYLYALEKRLKILFASRNITKANMPFGVTSICWIYSQTLEVLEANILTKVSIIEILKKELNKNLHTLYDIIDKKFVDAGILPNIKKKVAKPHAGKNKRVGQAQGDSHGLNQQQDQPNTQQTNSPALDTSNVFHGTQGETGGLGDPANSSELVKSIFDLMNQSRMQSSQSSQGNQASNIDNTTMDQTLNNLSKVTSVAAGGTEIDKLKEMILDDVKNETGIYYPTLTPQQQNSFDVMGMFYEQVKADNSIDGNILSSLNAINIPLIRTSITDEQFFNNPSHPARQYLEKLIYAAQKWHGTSVVKKLHQFSSSVASEYDGTPQSFDMANEDLESYLRLTERRAKKAEEKWVNAAKGKEKLNISRHKVEEVVENVAKNAVPEFVQNVIKYVIQDSLTLSLLRHGEDSEQWHTNINASTNIAKMANPELIKELTPKQKIESLHHLDQTMDELGFSENDRSRTLNNIKECANAATAGTLTKDIKLSEVATINKNKTNAKKAGSVKLEELRDLTEEEKTELTKIRLMPYGTLFDFIINQQRQKIRRKLSWFSPVSNKALFVTLLGSKPYERSLNAIAIDIARKNIIVVKKEKKKYFDSVLKTIFKKLQTITSPSAS